MYECDQPHAILVRTQELLKADPRSLATISLQSRIPYFWLDSFNKKRMSAPNINRVLFLYEFLTESKLATN